MQISQSLSFQTQHDLAKLFECVIIGMSRLHKCFQYMHSLTYPKKSSFIYTLITKGQTTILQWQQLVDFLGFHHISITREEAIGLSLIMGGGVEGISSDELTMYMKSRDQTETPYNGVNLHTQELKNEVEMTFVKLLEEELLLERNADSLRQKIESRWDYQNEALFKVISRGRLDSAIDYVKFKQFFTRLRYPITDEELYYLMKRKFGNEGQINFDSFQRVILTLSARVRNAVDEWGGKRQKSIQTVHQGQNHKSQQKYSQETHFSSKNVRYFERLKKKYMQNNFSQQLQQMNIPKRERAQSSHSNSKFLDGRKNRSTSVSQYPPPELISKSQIMHKNISLKDVTQGLPIKDAYRTPQKQPNQLASEYETIKAKRDHDGKQQTNFIRTTEKKSSMQETFKQLNSLTFPLFPLVKAQIRAIETNEKFFRNIPDGVVIQIRQICDIRDWAPQWQALGVCTYNFQYKSFSIPRQKELLHFVSQYKNVTSQSYETVTQLNKLDRETITIVQRIFELMENSLQTQRQAKLNFFTNKPCSFIQLFEELDNGAKGYLDEADLKNLLKNASPIEVEQNVFKIFFRQINNGQESNQISFNNFLRELTP